MKLPRCADGSYNHDEDVIDLIHEDDDEPVSMRGDRIIRRVLHFHAKVIQCSLCSLKWEGEMEKCDCGPIEE